MTATVFLFGLVLSFAAIGVVFYVKNKSHKQKHKIKCRNILETLHLHAAQIEQRHCDLANYNFLQYNLAQSLVVQHKIVL